MTPHSLLTLSREIAADSVHKLFGWYPEVNMISVFIILSLFTQASADSCAARKHDLLAFND